MIPGARMERGMSLVEMLISMTVFLLLAGAAFGLLIESQQRQRTESALLDSFQGARLGVDQIVRDVSDAGYPPPSFVTGTPDPTKVTSSPFAWGPSGYPLSPCVVGATCSTPGEFDLIVETNPDPATSGVQWVRYRLDGTTLLRGIVAKPAGPVADVDAFTRDSLVPYVENVMNNAPADQIAQIQAQYPAMFSGGPVPLFAYTYEGAFGQPSGIRDVNVTMIVMSPTPDPKTGRLRIAELNGRGRRINPWH